MLVPCILGAGEADRNFRYRIWPPADNSTQSRILGRGEMSAIGTWRTSPGAVHMSAFGGKAEICQPAAPC